MSLSAGTRIGSYEVVGSLGAGGMGEVYRAKDSKLKREVAIKVLPADVANDRERLARFQREAEVLASLNHPHIAQIYGIEDGTPEGVPYERFSALIMELVEGEDLSQRIARGAIPLDEALPIARQIAEALEAAHEQGIIHRDLKPANIKVRPDGTVKVLDFGLAKALDQGSGIRDQGSAHLANSPTITSPAMTLRGVILGTAAYMSPEQAKGKPVDRRADIWAFGCVLYEMLAGTRAFKGDDVTDIITAVMRDKPDWRALPPTMPASILTLLRRCLDKDPRNRAPHIAIARMEIADAMTTTGELVDHAPASPSRRPAWPLALGIGAAMAVAASALTLVLTLRAPAGDPAPPEAKFHIDNALSLGSLSPDGTLIAYRGRDAQNIHLMVRSLASGTVKSLPAAGDPGNPGLGSLGSSLIWSPTSTSIAFFAGQKLKRIDVASGTVQTLADAPTPRGGAWGPDGTILFAPGGNSPLYRVPAAGGTPEAVTELKAREASHRDPQFLPDGRRFLYWVLGPSGVRGMYAGSLDARSGTRLLDADGPACFAAPDQMLFVREGVLYAQRLDLDALKMTGEPVAVASGLSANPSTGRQVSASQTGVLTYRQDVEDRRQVQWVDRSGKPIENIGEPQNGVTAGSLSPDRETIALGITTHGRNDIWLMELARGTLTRVASDANQPVWSPDGTRLVFTSGQDGLLQMYSQRVGVNEASQVVFKSSEAQNAGDWSPDGRHVLFTSQSPTNARDLWVLPVDGNVRTPALLAGSPADEGIGRFSPDSRWVAHSSNETGAFEVFVRAFPGPGRAWRVSTNGGSNPFWRRDGKELYYLAGPQVMAVSIEAAAGTLRIGTPVPLFVVQGNLMATLDGQRFLVAVRAGEVPPAPLTVIVNWASRGK